ncbi:TPA: hypothetical protein IAA87_05020 [Candidatus Avigastranaerophilus faecigallinarum]|nr:hypothetical protein [Candidatus Avigastranaerophilus faecigallinarum]
MKVNSINSFNYNSTIPSFKHTAVPYPEYESAYYKNSDTFSEKIQNIAEKIAALFSPKVTEEAAKIKANIDSVYLNKSSLDDNLSPKKQLLSVLA